MHEHKDVSIHTLSTNRHKAPNLFHKQTQSTKPAQEAHRPVHGPSGLGDLRRALKGLGSHLAHRQDREHGTPTNTLQMHCTHTYHTPHTHTHTHTHTHKLRHKQTGVWQRPTASGTTPSVSGPRHAKQHGARGCERSGYSRLSGLLPAAQRTRSRLLAEARSPKAAQTARSELHTFP